jgi:hypothetical protein
VGHASQSTNRLNSYNYLSYNIHENSWLKITQSIPTKAYWDGTLQPKGTLDFYFEAAEAAVAEAKARYPDRKIHLLAHSIGGWCVVYQNRAASRIIISDHERQPNPYKSIN